MPNYTGTAGSDVYEFPGLSGGEMIDGLGGHDTLDASSTQGSYLYDLENNIISLTNGGFLATIRNFEGILAGDGDDIIYGGTDVLAYRLNGGTGDDTVGPGSEGIINGELYDGGADTDTLDLSRGLAPYVIDMNTGVIAQGARTTATIAGFEIIIGSNGDDFIREGTGVQTTVNGGLGDDTLATASSGVGGGEIFNGEAGTDRFDFSNQLVDYVVDLQRDAFERPDGSFATTLLSIEDVLAGSGNDTLIGTDAADTFRGGRGADRLEGNAGADVLAGNAGADIILGGNGADTIFGGSGNDTVAAGEGADSVDGSTGDDTIYGNDGADFILGGSGQDVIFGGTGNDTVAAGEGDDSVDGGTGDDLIYGNEGDDTLEGGGGADEISGGDDNDLILGRQGNDTLRGANHDDRIYGGGDDDLIAGNNGNDTLEGGSGDDRIFGGEGEDVINGGGGRDVLSGGNGADVFVFDSIADSPDSAMRDTIADFVHDVDLIDLSGIMDGLSFVGDTYTGAAGEVRYDATIGRLFIDADGDSVSDFSIVVTGAPTIDAGDLIL